eukprot:SAG31_NODE_2505_length_5592_cov_2.644639_4_plen_164_part_00
MLALLLLLAALLVLLNAGLASTAGTACELAIVGGGPGGLYTAWRLAVDTKTMKPSDICVFERAERFGGRTFSLRGQGTKKDLVVDLGAYRFCRSPNATDCAGAWHALPRPPAGERMSQQTGSNGKPTGGISISSLTPWTNADWARSLIWRLAVAQQAARCACQ